ncbi:MAG: TonB-dependent receptor [Puniceicoccales bacterium]|nr:TonB-dependent receptor [Puniceicoccales bacterium]
MNTSTHTIRAAADCEAHTTEDCLPAAHCGATQAAFHFPGVMKRQRGHCCLTLLLCLGGMPLAQLLHAEETTAAPAPAPAPVTTAAPVATSASAHTPHRHHPRRTDAAPTSAAAPAASAAASAAPATPAASAASAASAAPAAPKAAAPASVSAATPSTPSTPSTAPTPAPTPAAAPASDAHRLSDVVVTASGFEQVLINAPASISVIGQEVLELKPFVTLSDAVRDMPGIMIMKSKAGDDISMRGLSSDYTLILVDGKRQNSRQMRPNAFGEAETGFIPPLAAVERIEVVRGPMSTLYGSDAMGGVINIITKKVATKWGGSIGADYLYQLDGRLGDALSENFYLSGPIFEDKLGLSLWGRGHHRSEDRMGVAGNSPARIGAREAEINSVGARLTYTPTHDHDISLEGGSTHQTYTGTAGKTGTMGDAAGYDPSLRFNRDYYSLSHQGRWGIGTSDMALQYETAETKGRRVTGPPNIVPRTLEIENLVWDAKWTMPITYNHLTVGAQVIDSQGKDGVATGDLAMTQFSLFAEDELRIWEPLGVTGGIRYDHHDKFGAHFSPRGYIVFNATKWLAIKGGVSTGFKSPNLASTMNGISGIGGQGTIPLLGNSDLGPETSIAYEAGVYFHHDETGISASLMGFFNKFKDKLSSETIYPGDSRWPSSVNPADWPVGYGSLSINVDTAETKGFEASVKIPVHNELTFQLNYTYTKTEQTSGRSKGLPLTNMPEHAFNGTITWDIRKDVSLWVRGTYFSEQKSTSAGVPDYDAYGVLDLGASWKFNKNLTLKLGLYNVLDIDMHKTKTYTNPNNGATVSMQRYPVVDDGIRIWFGATYTF